MPPDTATRSPAERGTSGRTTADGESARDVSGGLPRRLHTLTGLRFFAAFAVFAHHFTGTGGTSGFGRAPAIFPYSMIGGHGVTFFFVLSGFLLTWVHKPSEPARVFYWRRAGRIWPAHLVALAPAVYVFYGLDHQPLHWPGLLASVLLVQPWLPGLVPTLPGNPVTWTLGVELLFYALFPLLIRAALRLRTRTLVAVTAVGLAGMWAVNWWAGTVFSADTEGWVMRHPVVYLPQFLLGMTCALALRRGWRPRLRPALPLGLLALTVVLYYQGRQTLAPDLVAQTDYLVRPVVALLSALVITAFVRREVAGRPGLVGGRTVVALGTWSYCFYLVHQSVIDFAVHRFGRGPDNDTALLTMVGMALVATALAWALCRYVEEPAARWWNRHLPSALRRPTPVAPAPRPDAVGAPPAHPGPAAATAGVDTG